jgi:hypothetical protein
MNVGIVPSKILSSKILPGRFRAGRTRSTTSPAAGLRPLSPEQEAQARVEMAASDEPAFDWPGTVAACVELTKQGFMARAKFIPDWDRWIIEARQKAWPPDEWGTLRKDGTVRLQDGQAEPVAARRTRWLDDLRPPTVGRERVDERAG